MFHGVPFAKVAKFSRCFFSQSCGSSVMRNIMEVQFKSISHPRPKMADVCSDGCWGQIRAEVRAEWPHWFDRKTRKLRQAPFTVVVSRMRARNHSVKDLKSLHSARPRHAPLPSAKNRAARGRAKIGVSLRSSVVLVFVISSFLFRG